MEGLIVLGLVILVREFFYQRERQENARQTQALLQRIQAPEVAVMAHAETPSQLTNKLPVFTDEDYAERLSGH